MSGVGREVRRRREARGWSQPKLAVEAGMAVSAVSQIETGKRRPSANSLEKLSGALGVAVADLFPKAQSSLPLEQPLISLPAIQEWLRANGHMTEDEFLRYAERLDLDIDEEGVPRGLEHALDGLRMTCNYLEGQLNQRPILDVLFPRQSGGVGEEAIQELFKQNTDAWKLRAELRHEYLVRELALMNYGRRLHAEGITSDHLMYARTADYERRSWIEASYAEAGAA